MENNIEIKKSDTLIYEKIMDINKGDLDCYYDIDLTDEEGNTKRIYDNKKGDSLVANFLRGLYMLMTRTNSTTNMDRYYRYATFNASQISSISSGTSNVFRINFNSSVLFDVSPTGIVSLSGFNGITLQGTYTFNKISSSSMDIVGTTYSSGWQSGTGGGMILLPTINRINNITKVNFENKGIFVGKGTKAVEIDDQCLDAYIPNHNSPNSLTYNSYTTSVESIDSTSGQITMTRTFTNNTNDAIQVNEIALFVNFNGQDTMVMRDLLPTAVNVGVGQTLTVNYRIRTVLSTGTDAGGFIASFVRLMYRQIAQTARNCYTVAGSNLNHYMSYLSFMCCRAGGNTALFTIEIDNFYIGIVLGSSNQNVSMEDYFLISPINHGKDTGQLLYYGSFGQDFTIGSNYAEFSILRVFENNTASDITIREYALCCGWGDDTASNSNSYYPMYAYTLSRNVLSTPIILESGKMLKFVYKIRISTTGGS